MKYIILTIICIASFATYANDPTGAICNIDPNWSSSKINQTLMACKEQAAEQAKQAAVDKTIETAKDVKSYAGLAKEIAEAIGIAAKEVGVATNEFIKTDAGKMTIAIIVWHVAGDDIRGIVFGIPLLIFIIWLYFSLTKRLRRTDQYTTVKTLFGNERSVPILKPFNQFSDSEYFILATYSMFCGVFAIVAVSHIL